MTRFCVALLGATLLLFALLTCIGRRERLERRQRRDEAARAGEPYIED